MDLEQIRADFKAGIMISRATWEKVLEASQIMEDGLLDVVDHGKDAGQVASDCLGSVAAL